MARAAHQDALSFCESVSRAREQLGAGYLAPPGPRRHSKRLGFGSLCPTLPGPAAAAASAQSVGNAASSEPETETETAAAQPELQLVVNDSYLCSTATAGELAGVSRVAWSLAGAGDLINVRGHPGKTRTGTKADDLSLFATSVSIVSMAPGCDRVLSVLQACRGGFLSEKEAC
eukprot:SAG31_NODE_13564_length_861_cov_0.912073_1_plen_173_part_01